ncbi:MAG: hypothetical protein LBJ03_00395 [Holosporales bacterium]|jgi:hypothetical protein|nr:hypothetical protein [Holosporales bacterium]
MNKFFCHAAVFGCVLLQSIAPAQGARTMRGRTKTPATLKAEVVFGLLDLLPPALDKKTLYLGASFDRVKHVIDRRHFLPLGLTCNKWPYEHLVTSNPEVGDIFRDVKSHLIELHIGRDNPDVIDMFGALYGDSEFILSALEYRKIASDVAPFENNIKT